ncbi:peptidase [Micromonospora siamensis]|uniref:Peptidase n=1 Tax=Micromonospora siamensis TaxID=299152 RepID=A0A1C5HAR6_9ACTN|nr:peptidase [Micromonospora siamensis]SCG43043.1 hypothetical protein GA0074704_1357 [Micromonospora siamensis]
MRTPLIVSAAALAALAGPALPAAAAPTPSPGAATVTKAGTSFLTATAITAGQPVQVGASTGDYLYWSFTASAGQVHRISATVSFPKARGGPSVWSVDVFDGLRRRQACTTGAQTPLVDATATSVELGCTLREVRSWADPWSADPLPGTYYVRLSVAELPEADLGLPVDVDLLVSADSDGGATADDGELKAPLTAENRAGAVLTGEPTPAPVQERDGVGWLPALGSRWAWTTAGGILAAVAGVVGFGLTRRPRRP